MNKRVRLVLVVLGLAGAAVVVQKKVSAGGVPQATAPKLPLLCRIKGHGWKMPPNSTQTPIRKACQQCQRIDVPMPR